MSTAPKYVKRLRTMPTAEEVAGIVKLAQTLVEAHGRRSATSEYATLSEEDAIFNLRWHLVELAKAINCG